MRMTNYLQPGCTNTLNYNNFLLTQFPEKMSKCKGVGSFMWGEGEVELEFEDDRLMWGFYGDFLSCCLH